MRLVAPADHSSAEKGAVEKTKPKTLESVARGAGGVERNQGKRFQTGKV